jgi:hypothetical protein
MINDSVPIILVYLGNKIPTYLKKNIEYLKSTRTNPITLLTDVVPKGKNWNSLGIEVLDSRNFQKGWQSSLRSDYRSGFWQNTKKRLFVLSEFLLSQKDPRDALHIEGDVWLSPNVNFSKEIVPSRISFPLFTGNRASGSIILVSKERQRKNLERFRTTLLNHHQLTDMESLQMFLDIFPESAFGLTSDPDEETRGLVFDAAPIGMHLFGEDPRNQFGRFKQFSDYSYLGYKTLNKKEFDVRRNSLWVSTRTLNVEIACLHLHSKSTKLFSYRWTKEMERVIIKRKMSQGQEIARFSFLGFLIALRDYAGLFPSYFKRKILSWR